MKTKYLIIFVSSLLLLLSTYWAYSYPYTASWVGSACYFVLTLLFLQRYDDGHHTSAIAWCVLAGRLLPELPFRILYPTTLFADFYITALTIASVVLAATYHRYRYGVVLVLSTVIMVLLNTLGYDAWRVVAGH